MAYFELGWPIMENDVGRPLAASFRERVILEDSTPVDLRPVSPSDAEALKALFHRLSPESVYYRFLEVRKDLSMEQARRFAQVDYRTTMAIVAELVVESGVGPLVGVARYGRSESSPSGFSEAAIVVEDAYQGKGLGTALLLKMVNYAQSAGIKGFHATIHQSNSRILSFIKSSGLPSDRRLEGGIWEIKVYLPAAGERKSEDG
jgi:acetyltransferase